MDLEKWIHLLEISSSGSEIKLTPKTGTDLLGMLKELQRFRQGEAQNEGQLTEEELIELQRLLGKFGSRCMNVTDSIQILTVRNWVSAYLQGVKNNV